MSSEDKRQFYLKKWMDLIAENEDGTQAIYNAMAEYAKEEAISLLRYWNYECVGYPIEDGDEQMFEETYNDYIQSKNQKP